MARIFHVRINLDKVSADNDTFSNDQERGEWLRGFLSAARGGLCRFAGGSPGALGHALGAESLRFAQGFSAAQAVKGHKSAEARKCNHGSTTVQPRLYNGSTEPQPNLNLSNNPIIEQSTIEEPINEQSTREAGNPAKRKPAFIPPTVDEVREYCDEHGVEIDADRFVNYYESKGWLVGKTKMANWKAAAKGWHARQSEMVKAVPTDPDRFIPCTPTQEQMDIFNGVSK